MANELEEVNQQYIEEYIPAIVIVTFIIIVGLTGNIAAVIYYGWKAEKSVVQLLVLLLSFNDALTNVILVNDVVEFFYYVTYRSRDACKTIFLLRHWLICNSLLFIFTISVDRFRRVCFPFAKQFTVTSVRYLVVGLALVSFLNSARVVVTADVVRINISIVTNSTKGFYCTSSDNIAFQTIEIVSKWVEICLHAIIICCLILFYSLVVRKILQSRRNLKRHSSGVTVNWKRNHPKSPQPISSKEDTVQIEFSKNQADDAYALALKPGLAINHPKSPQLISSKEDIVQIEFSESQVDDANELTLKPGFAINHPKSPQLISSKEDIVQIEFSESQVDDANALTLKPGFAINHPQSSQPNSSKKNIVEIELRESQVDDANALTLKTGFDVNNLKSTQPNSSKEDIVEIKFRESQVDDANALTLKTGFDVNKLKSTQPNSSKKNIVEVEFRESQVDDANGLTLKTGFDINNLKSTQPNSSKEDIVEFQFRKRHEDDAKTTTLKTGSDINNSSEQTEVKKKVLTLKKSISLKQFTGNFTASELRITTLVAVITLASILCFVPYYFSVLFVSRNMSGDGLIIKVGYILLKSSYMLNSTINPVIMFIFNEAFRSFIKSIPRCHCFKR